MTKGEPFKLVVPYNLLKQENVCLIPRESEHPSIQCSHIEFFAIKELLAKKVITQKFLIAKTYLKRSYEKALIKKECKVTFITKS